MDTFYDDFTTALESCLGSLFFSTPLDKWNPQETAAPERHKFLYLETEEVGTTDDDAWEDAVEQLEGQNPAFGLLESMVRIFFVASDVDELGALEKEQVWLFAHHWLSVYYEFLMDTRAVHTTFYKNYHERFLEVLRNGLSVSAKKRSTFRDLALAWKPTMVRAAPIPSVLSVVPSFPSAAAAAATDSPPSRPPPPKRLVLQGPRGHNRTRRNLHS